MSLPDSSFEVSLTNLLLIKRPVKTCKVGRICIPEEMAKAVGITDEAVLVGLLDRFEIWSPERFTNVKAADAVMARKLSN